MTTKEIENIEPKEIKLPQIDVTPFAGQKVKIVKVTYHENNDFKRTSYFAKLETEDVAVIETATEPIIIRGTKNLGLAIDENKNIGWGKGTKTDEYLKYMKVSTIKELIGKEVTLKLTDPVDGKVYLTF